MHRNAWVRHYNYNPVFNPIKIEISEVKPVLNTETISVFTTLPDDLLERILSSLPIASIFKASSVCKKWHEVIISKRFLWNFSYNILLQKPWYFMFTRNDEFFGYSYDPTLKKWYSINLPHFVTSNWFIASSFGLVCFMNNDTKNEVYVSNPITKSSMRLTNPNNPEFSDYTALAISVDKKSHNYTVSIVSSKQIPENFYEWNISIDIYNSKTMTWINSLSEVLNGWRGGDESVICGGALYFLLYSTGAGISDNRHGLIKYNLSNHSSHGLLSNFIPAPCSLTCGRLMNLNEKLVMVGGIGKHERSDIIKGIGIWVLKGRQWLEVARMPHKYFHGFGEFDDVFASSGIEDVIYIQSYGAPSLLLFDMKVKQWKWSQKCPVTKRFPLQLFTGFCFDPRLEVSP